MASTGKPPPRTTESSSAILLVESKAVVSRRPPSLLEHLSVADRTIVLSKATQRTLAPGELLFHQGDPHEGIVIVESGRVRSFYIAPSGREITLAYWLPGNFIGGPQLFGGGVHMWSAKAAHRTSITMFEGPVLRELARQLSDFAMGLIDALVFKATCYAALAQMLGTRSVAERLRQLLLYLADLHGIAEPDGTLIAAAFSHADLAHLVGATKQWVTVNLTKLQKAGVLSYKRRFIVIHRPDLLAKAPLED